MKYRSLRLQHLLYSQPIGLKNIHQIVFFFDITKTCRFNFDPLTGVYIIVLIAAQKQIVGTRTHNLYFEQKYEKYRIFFSSENFHFLVVNFSVYLNRHVFVKYKAKSLDHNLQIILNDKVYDVYINLTQNYYIRTIRTCNLVTWLAMGSQCTEISVQWLPMVLTGMLSYDIGT